MSKDKLLIFVSIILVILNFLFILLYNIVYKYDEKKEDEVKTIQLGVKLPKSEPYCKKYRWRTDMPWQYAGMDDASLMKTYLYNKYRVDEKQQPTK